jgi:GST-like protein
MGDFSIADLETYAWLAGITGLLPDAFAGKTQLAAWMDRIRRRPAVARALSLSQSGNPREGWAPGPEINRWG